MRRLMLLALAVSVVAMALTLPATVRAGAEVVTDTVKNGTDTFTFVDPCTGQTSTVTATFNSVFHDVERPNDTFMLANQTEGSFFLVPDDPNLPTASGHFVTTFTLAGGSNTVISQGLNVSGVDANGERVVLHVLEQLTESATGHVVQFQKGCD